MNELRLDIEQVMADILNRVEYLFERGTTKTNYCVVEDDLANKSNDAEILEDCTQPDISDVGNKQGADVCKIEVPVNEFHSRQTVRRLLPNVNDEEYSRLVNKAENSELKILVNGDIGYLLKCCLEEGITPDFTIRRNEFLRMRDSRKRKPEEPYVSNSRKRKEYEVEAIIDYDSESKKYLVKWHGWAHESNTWEPEGNLEGSSELLEAFNLEMHSFAEKDYVEWRNKLVNLQLLLSKITATEYNDLCVMSKFSETLGVPMSKTNIHLKKIVSQKCEILNEMKTDEFKFYAFGPKRLCLVIADTLKLENGFGSVDAFVDFIRKRNNLPESLKRWENEMNSVINKDTCTSPDIHRGQVYVENDVDLEGPPENFTYITKSIPYSDEIQLEPIPIYWCDCLDCYEDKKSCCSKQLDSKLVYTREGVLRDGRNGHIVECNDKCSCDINCPNRVIQKGTQVDLVIFRTNDDRGWGVKAKERILKGKYVMEYVGEIVPINVADERGRKYGIEGRTYLFDLDFNDEMECQYSVDATRFGNVSHFVNHSCDPNLEVYVAWTSHLDHRLPRLVFFSRRQIFKGEELTFDYRMTRPNNSPEAEVKQIPCRCGSAECKKILYL